MVFPLRAVFAGAIFPARVPPNNTLQGGGEMKCKRSEKTRKETFTTSSLHFAGNVNTYTGRISFAALSRRRDGRMLNDRETIKYIVEKYK